MARPSHERQRARAWALNRRTMAAAYGIEHYGIEHYGNEGTQSNQDASIASSVVLAPRRAARVCRRAVGCRYRMQFPSKGVELALYGNCRLGDS